MQKEDYILTDRKKELLLSSVESYIETAIPITSEKVHKSLYSEVSSATLRNELNGLEQMGFLKQLHTSGGRIPTTKAYRYFVNSLISSNNLDINSINIIKDKFVNRSAFLVEMLDNVAKSISEITNFPTFVHISGFKELKLLGINIIPLLTGQALVLLKTDAGVISNSIVLSADITEENCKDASKFLTTNLYNKKIIDVIENIDFYNSLLKNQIKFYKELFISLTQVLEEYCKNGSSFIKNVNPSRLLNNPEYKDIDNAKKFLNLVENEEEIKNIIKNINENTDSEIVFSIGEENNNQDLNDYSIIKANYSLANGITTSIGVVGLKRMDYAKIASALKYIIDEMKQLEQPADYNKKGDSHGKAQKRRRTKNEKL